MKLATFRCCMLGFAALVLAIPAGCAIPVPDGSDNTNTNGNANTNDNDNGTAADPVELFVYASNTGGATGLSLRPSDGAVFAVNVDGLFGPIEDGDDLSTMTAFGATNLAAESLFDMPTASLSLAITESGEFWIGSPCCSTIAVVPPEGGDAEAFLDLLAGSEIKPEVIVRVPEGFEADQMFPGQLLFGQETSFSRLVGVDAEGDRAVLDIDNPSETNRNAHYLAFGLDGVLYSSKGASGLTQAGFQTIGVDGSPAEVPGTLGAAADTFVALANGDFVIRGTLQSTATSSQRGVLLYDAAVEEVTLGIAIPTEEVDENDDMVITPDGTTILLSLPKRNEIVLVTVNGADGG